MDKVLKDFFISYRGLDQAWAEWIAYHLEEANYSVVIQAWDFQPGSSFIHAMDKATREARSTIAVLSPEYFASPYTTVEWQAAYHKDPTGEQGFLLPVRVRPCQVEGLLGPFVYIDLVDLDEAQAREKLLAGVHRHDPDQPKRAKPAGAPGFPGKVQHSVAEPHSFPGAFPPLWNMPFRRNPFFTGREELLKHLRDNLTTTKAAALVQAQAISGLGGIGKTQTAVEYAYRYYHTYRAVLWVNAATRDALITSYVELAVLLVLPEREEQDQKKNVVAVKHWFTTHDQWLLIVDNADELPLVEEFLPAAGHGHLLLTTRAAAPGTLAQRIEVEKMDLEESMLLLLRRARVLASGGTVDQASAADRAEAEALAREMDGLPLALDQAGAYIEETQSRLSAYLQQYRQRQVRFLQRRGGSGTEHLETVAKTWSLSFEKVEQLDPTAADLLRFCAFLAPDAIPEQLILDAASELGPRLQPIAADPSLLDEAIATLLRYSLVKRKPDEQTIAVHRLVQSILKTSMDAATRQAWAYSTVRALNHAFPDVTDYRNWPQCQQYLPHAQACVPLIDQWQLAFPEARRLLNEVGNYLYYRAQYAEAEPLYQRAITIGEKVLGPEHSDLATQLNNLALLYKNQGKYGEAEPLYQRALAIGEKVLGSEHPNLAIRLNNLANLYADQGKYGEAEPLYQRALVIGEKLLGSEHPDLAAYLNNLANLYRAQGKYTEAEPLFQRALAISEKVLGPEHPDLATQLNSLALLYKVQGKYAEAEPLYQRAIAIDEKVLGPEHPGLAIDFNNLALLYKAQGKYAEAEPLYQRAMAIGEKVLGHEHPDLATRLNNLAGLYRDQGKYTEAEPLYRRSLGIFEKVLGEGHRSTETVRANYAALQKEMRQKGKG